MQFPNYPYYPNPSTWVYSPDITHQPTDPNEDFNDDFLSISMLESTPLDVEDPQSPTSTREFIPLNERSISHLSQLQEITPSETSSYIPQPTFQALFPSLFLSQEQPFFSETPTVKRDNNIPYVKQEPPFQPPIGQSYVPEVDISQQIFYSFFPSSQDIPPTIPLSLSHSSVETEEDAMKEDPPISRRRSKSDPYPLKHNNVLSEQEKLIKQEERREKNRASAQASRLRQKKHIQELEREQKNTIALGKKVEGYVEYIRVNHPSTTLSSHKKFAAQFTSSSEELSEKAKKVEMVQQRIEQVIGIISQETIEAEKQRKEIAAKNASLEERVKQLELEIRLLRLQATHSVDNLFMNK